MKNKTYTVKGNRTAADVVAGNDEVIETGYDLECATIAKIELQRSGEFVACWIEEEGPKGPSVAIVLIAPRVDRTTVRELPRVTTRMPSMAALWFACEVA